MESYDAVVVGGGISGLSMAHYCAGLGLRTVVLEANPRAGGTFHSHHWPGMDDFWVELGCHTCYNSYGHLIDILDQVGVRGEMVARRRMPFRMLVNGGVHSIPSQLHWPELLRSAPRALFERKGHRSVAEYYGRIVGRRNFAEVIGPAFNAVACQEAAGLPASLLFRPKPRRHGVMRSFTFHRGLQTVTDALVSRAGFEFRGNTPVQAVTQFQPGYLVEIRDGLRLRSEFLILATPVGVSAELLRSEFPTLSHELMRIGQRQVESLAVAVPADSVRLKPLAGLIPRDDALLSVVSRDTLPHPTLRGFALHFRPGRLDSREKLARATALLGTGEPAGVVEKINTVPAPPPNHEEVIANIDAQLAGHRLFMTGNYFKGLSIEDCVERSALEFERLSAMV